MFGGRVGTGRPGDFPRRAIATNKHYPFRCEHDDDEVMTTLMMMIKNIPIPHPQIKPFPYGGSNNKYLIIHTRNYWPKGLGEISGYMMVGCEKSSSDNSNISSLHQDVIAHSLHEKVLLKSFEQVEWVCVVVCGPREGRDWKGICHCHLGSTHQHFPSSTKTRSLEKNQKSHFVAHIKILICYSWFFHKMESLELKLFPL